MERQEKMVVALAGCSHAFSHGYMLIFPAVLLLLQKEFSLGYLELGIIGNIMFFTYGLGALPGGMIYNLLGPKRLYLICFIGSTVSLILAAASSSLLVLTAGLALLGVFGSLYHPLANAMITGKVREYGRALGIHGAAGNLGLAMAPFAAGVIASHLGWRHAYLWFALPGILLSVWSIFVDMSPGEEMKAFGESTSEKKSSGSHLKIYFSLPLVLVYLANMMHSFCFNGSLTFLPAYMAKRTSFHLFSLDSVALGGMLSSIVLLMGVVGQFGGGILSQKPDLERKFLIVSAISLPFIVAMSFTTDILLLGLALIFFFFNFFLQPMNNTLLAQYTAANMRGPAFGIYFFVAFVFGSLASSFSGYVAQVFGLQWVFTGLSGSILLLVFFAFVLQKIKRHEAGGMNPDP
ncbi:MAG: MFS transporter [Syntrophaceae bacterium]|nr:MFS transporter [Syntrophaceae bacterium]